MDIFEAEMVRRFVVAVEKIANALGHKDEPTISKMEQVETEPTHNQHVQRVEYIGNDEKSRCWTCKHFESMHETPISSDGKYYTYVICTASECNYEPKDEPQTCEECEHWSDTEDGCADRHGCKTEPQTQLTAKCLECNNSKACKENHWEDCRYEPLGYEVTAVVGTIKDEPQTDCTTCDQVGRCERGRAVDCPLTERRENDSSIGL